MRYLDTLRSKTGTAKKAAERYVFLFESHLVLCKITPNVKHKNGASNIAEYRPKEWVVMRKVEILDREEAEGLLKSFCFKFSLRRFFSDANLKFAFEIRQQDVSQPPIVLFAKSAEEKHDWMSAIVNLQTRRFVEIYW